MVLIIIGTSSYFVMMALITVWAEQANKIATNFERNFEIVKHVLSQLNVSENVNNDVRSFMSQLWSNQYGYRDETVLSLLPHNIRVSIMYSLSLGVLENITFFNNVPKGFMNELLLAFSIKSYCPNELLFSGNVVTHFFIIYQGTCNLKARLKDDGSNEKKRRVSQESTDSSSNIMIQTLQNRDYFGLEALEVFNQLREARKQRAERMIKQEKAEPQDDTNSEEPPEQEPEAEEVIEEVRNRKKKARRHRLSYYTSFENEEEALSRCPFDEFVIRADSSGFSTIIAISNDEFEEVLSIFPQVKAKILQESENPDAYSSQSMTRQNTNSQLDGTPRKSRIISQSELADLGMAFGDDGEFEITFENNNAAAAAPENEEDTLSVESSVIHSREKSQKRSMATYKLSQSRSMAGRQTNAIPNSNSYYEEFGLIHPLSNFKLWWNISSLLFCLYNMMIVPYLIAFIVDKNAGFILIDICLDIFFCVDVYMRLDRFTFIEEGFVEQNKSVIRSRYVGIKLVLDLVSSVPWDLIVVASIGFSAHTIQIYYWLRLVRLLRWHNFKTCIAEIDQFIEDRRIRIKPTMLRIVYQLIFVLIVCHWGASVFYFAGQSWLRSESSPVFYSQPQHQLPSYLLSAYYSLITMSSVGFGDIKPQTFAETCCRIMIMILGVLAYATTTAFIASFAAHANPPSEAFRKKSQPIEKYLKTLKLSTMNYGRDSKVFHH
eukprot:204969_1